MLTPQQALAKIKSYEKSESREANRHGAAEREALILEHAHLVKYIAARLINRLPPSVTMEDLMSAGIIGLMEAIEKFDPRRNIQFKTYAEFRIRGAMLDELRLLDWVPRSVRRKVSLLEQAYGKVQNATGRQAEEEEVRAELGMDQERFHRLLQEVRGLSLISENELTRVCPNLNYEDLLDLFAARQNEDPLEVLGLSEVRRIVAEAIEKLPQKERLVLTLYYYEELTMREIAEVMDYTESRISQLHTQAILRTRRSLRQYFPERERCNGANPAEGKAR
jgi:RNA polymerase sigma factor for flagellar operon FliA